MPVENPADLRASPFDMRDLSVDPGQSSVRVLSHGSMEVRWFRPDDSVQHNPHDRDELYFVVSGTAQFYRGGEAGPFDEGSIDVSGPAMTAVGAGDVLFVPAGAYHDFNDTSADFAVWAVFYGPEGGESDETLLEPP